MKEMEMNWKRKTKETNRVKAFWVVFGSWATYGWGAIETKGRRMWKGKEKKMRKMEGAGSSCKREKNSVILWSVVWTAKRALFCMEFWGRVLLDARNVSMMADFVFNNPISRPIVGKLNPKTLIKYFFSWKKIINFVVRS